MPKHCQICGSEIKGKAFSLSDLSPVPKVIEVCEKCAGSDWVTIDIDGVEVTVRRDDYIRCDKERLQYALDQALTSLEDQGWEMKGISVEGRSETICEELE